MPDTPANIPTDPPPGSPFSKWSLRGRRWRRLQAHLSTLQKIDSWFFALINNLPHTRFLNGLMRLVALLMNRGDGWLLGLLVAATVDYARRRTKGYRVLRRVALPLWLATATVEFPLKSLFRRKRPFAQLEQSILVGVPPRRHSFPSGHSAAGFAGAWLLSRYYPKWRPVFYAVALLVGFCRIYLGAHFPADVVAGAISGTGLAELYRRLLRIRATAADLERPRAARPSPPSDAVHGQ